MAGRRPIPLGERIGLLILGAIGAALFVCAPKLLHWWIIWSGEQLDAIAALLGWR